MYDYFWRYTNAGDRAAVKHFAKPGLTDYRLMSALSQDRCKPPPSLRGEPSSPSLSALVLLFPSQLTNSHVR